MDFTSWDAGLHSNDPNSLRHYGVKGMRKGVIRNPKLYGGYKKDVEFMQTHGIPSAYPETAGRVTLVKPKPKTTKQVMTNLVKRGTKPDDIQKNKHKKVHGMIVDFRRRNSNWK